METINATPACKPTTLATIFMLVIVQLLPSVHAQSRNFDGTLSAAQLLKHGLESCISDLQAPVDLKNRKRVSVLVHGANGTTYGLGSLATAIASQGDAALCFVYNDRSDLSKAAAQLGGAIDALAALSPGIRIVVIGHSLGGLVARKALVAEDPSRFELNAQLHLVTIATPFAGIRSARPCGSVALRVVSLGLQDFACWLISGGKWHQITHASRFIRDPGQLHPAVQSFLLIRTDERDSCRRFDSERQCLEDDYVFSLAEQRLPRVFGGVQPLQITLKTGHVKVIGELGSYPTALISALRIAGVYESERLALQWPIASGPDRSL